MNQRELLKTKVEEKVSECRESIVEIVESFSFEKIAKKGGLSSKKEFKEVKKLEEECSAKMEALLSLEREVEPKEMYKLSG